MYKLIIPGTLPGLNEFIDAERAHRLKGARMKRDAETIVRYTIRQQLNGVKPKTPVWFDYCFIEPSRRRDKDNISAFAHKIIQDSFVKEGILDNDGWKHVEGYMDTFEVDPENPRIEVTLLEPEEERE